MSELQAAKSFTTRAVPLPSSSADDWNRTPSSPKLAFDAERLLNILVALAMLVAFGPLMIFVAAAVKLHDGGPVFFAHTRVGRGGHSFPCLKFRSMAVDADTRLRLLLDRDSSARSEWEHGFKLQRDPRVTGLGALLRKTSLDELPQILNVLRGDMNIVGPRPIVHAEIPRYGHYFSYYCQVRPGITGLWQVSGRNSVSYRTRVAMDVSYVRAKSMLVDLKILFLTVPMVLLRRGAC